MDPGAVLLAMFANYVKKKNPPGLSLLIYKMELIIALQRVVGRGKSDHECKVLCPLRPVQKLGEGRRPPPVSHAEPQAGQTPGSVIECL